MSRMKSRSISNEHSLLAGGIKLISEEHTLGRHIKLHLDQPLKVSLIWMVNLVFPLTAGSVFHNRLDHNIDKTIFDSCCFFLDSN